MFVTLIDWTVGKGSGSIMTTYLPELLLQNAVDSLAQLGTVPVDFLHPKFRVAHTKHDVISILMNKYTYINMYIIKKIISCKFILS